jgi:hypothetical protein
MSRDVFLAEFKRSFLPTLRKEGFRGSGTTFRRRLGELTHVVNLQGSKWGDECFLNLGAHLSFLVPVGGEPPDPDKLKEYDCAFRTRINPEVKPAKGWSYGIDDVVTRASVAALCAAYQTEGARFFNQFSAYPESFATVSAASLGTSAYAHSLASGSPLVWAQIALQIGNVAAAREFAKLGLAAASPRASLYRAECERIANGP